MNLETKPVPFGKAPVFSIGKIPKQSSLFSQLCRIDIREKKRYKGDNHISVIYNKYEISLLGIVFPWEK